MHIYKTKFNAYYFNVKAYCEICIKYDQIQQKFLRCVVLVFYMIVVQHFQEDGVIYGIK